MLSAVRFLGASDSQGVPRWWCGCKVCDEARATGKNARTRPSVIIEGSETILIDAAPELRLQVSREGVRDIDAVLITHAHNDHVLGLGDIGDWANRMKKRCPIYAPAEVLPLLKPRFAYLTHGRYRELCPFLPLEQAGRTFAGYELTAIKVPHGFNGWSYGFKFRRGDKQWAYMPDCLGLKSLEPWRNLDLLVLGTSFYHEEAPIASRSVYDVQEALELVQALQPREVVFTHLGHGIDARKPAPEGTRYAFDGLTLELPC